jgi:branched-chain amino acid transport system ATP-binding protein
MTGTLSGNDEFFRTEALTKFFGGLAAVVELDMSIKRGEILGLIGPNGAGKTTLFNLITGFLSPTRGEVFLEGERITNLKPHTIAKRGIVRSFQANVLFMEKTVKENVLMGFHTKYRNGFVKEVFRTKSYVRERSGMEKKAEEILDFFSLSGMKYEMARNLTHGHQRILGVAMALAPQPCLLMLDEPVAGLNDEETTTMMRLIQQIRNTGVTILLVEHDMKAVMGNCERIIVLDYGRKIAEGTPSDIVRNEKVIQAYLGTGDYDA